MINDSVPEANTDEPKMTNGGPAKTPGWKKAAVTGAVLAGALGIGGVVAGTAFAGATAGVAAVAPGDTTDSTTTPAAPDSTVAPDQVAPDGSKPMRSGEELLTGDTAEKVKAAVLAKYPDAEIVRMESDSDGVYEAHIHTAAGERLTVLLDAKFAITGTETGPTGGPGGGMRDNLEAVTGEAADKVKAAVLAKYPDAEVHRLGLADDGTYRAFVNTTTDERLVVTLDAKFAITDAQAAPAGRGPGGGHGGRGGCGPDGGPGTAPDGTAPTAPGGSTGQAPTAPTAPSAAPSTAPSTTG